MLFISLTACIGPTRKSNIKETYCQYYSLPTSWITLLFEELSNERKLIDLLIENEMENLTWQLSFWLMVNKINKID